MDHSNLPLFAFKICTKCGESKPLFEFSRNSKNKDGLHVYCRSCARAVQAQWREANRERRRAYMQQWHAENREHESKYARERYQDEEYRQRALGWQRQWRKKNLEAMREKERSRPRDWTSPQVRARTVVNRVVRRGELPPAWSMVCEHCQEAQAAEWHHHKGYELEHRLDVIALCVQCHGKEHRAQ